MSVENMCLTTANPSTDCHFDDKWEAIQKTLTRVLTASDATRAELSAAERRAGSLCRQHFGPFYVRLYVYLAEHVVACRHRVEGGARLPTVNARDGMLDRYAAEWTQYRRGLAALDRLLVQFRLELRSRRQNMNPRGGYEYRVSKTVPFEKSPWPRDMMELGLSMWQQFMLWPAERVLWPRVTEALLAVSEGAALVGKTVLRTAISTVHEVCQYDTDRWLETYQRWVLDPYLLAAKTRHAETARTLLEKGDVSQYLRRALAGRQGARVVADKYLLRSSREAVVKGYESTAIIPHVGRVQAEVAGLLAAAATGANSSPARDDLRNLCTLLREQDALQPVRDAARAHVAAEGREVLAKLTDEREMPQQFVQSVWTLDRKYSELFADVFKSEPSFVGALETAFRTVVRSLKGTRESELLARHCDQLLRAPEGAGGDAQGEEQYAAIISVLKRIGDTDPFYGHYQKALALRLFEHTCASTQREIAMIDQLKLFANDDCARKLYRMHEDISTSATLNGRFKLWHEEVNGPESSEFSVLLLQKWAWPLPEPALAVPAAIKNRTDLFSMWYGEQHPMHRLAWHQSSTGELVLHYTAQLFHVTASVLQCAMLLAFETEDRWGSKELRQHLQLEKDEWVKQLRPLLELKLLLPSGDVLEQGAGGEEAEGTLTLNLDFADERTSIKIACAVLPPVQPAAAAARGEARRGVGCEAFLHAKIVRLMKQRQTLQHDELLKVVVAEARPWFSPAPEQIVKCIESLIRKEYLERVADSSNTYAYLP